MLAYGKQGLLLGKEMLVILWTDALSEDISNTGGRDKA